MKNENLRGCVAENLRACQLRQVELLCHVRNICEKHGLQYWLDGGTLLGAVRHKGFIPWDDDLDIVMPQEDLQKFITIAQQELSQDIFLQTAETDPSTPHLFAKLRDMNSLFIEFRDDFKEEYQKGIYLDIFGFVPYPSVSPPRITKFITKKINKSYVILHAKHYYSLRSVAELFWFTAMYICMKVLWGGINLFKKKIITSRI
ncbi:MAG: LicD family protein [Firmicutes bacterium]|nr:LicD family protein [Bacillota bacterium]